MIITTIDAIDARSRWEEHEAAVAEAQVRWAWLVSALKDTDEGHAERLERARLKLGLGIVKVSGWGVS